MSISPTPSGDGKRPGGRETSESSEGLSSHGESLPEDEVRTLLRLDSPERAMEQDSSPEQHSADQAESSATPPKGATKEPSFVSYCGEPLAPWVKAFPLLVEQLQSEPPTPNAPLADLGRVHHTHMRQVQDSEGVSSGGTTLIPSMHFMPYQCCPVVDCPLGPRTEDCLHQQLNQFSARTFVRHWVRTHLKRAFHMVCRACGYATCMREDMTAHFVAQHKPLKQAEIFVNEHVVIEYLPCAVIPGAKEFVDPGGLTIIIPPEPTLPPRKDPGYASWLQLISTPFSTTLNPLYHDYWDLERRCYIPDDTTQVRAKKWPKPTRPGKNVTEVGIMPISKRKSRQAAKRGRDDQTSKEEPKETGPKTKRSRKRHASPRTSGNGGNRASASKSTEEAEFKPASEQSAKTRKAKVHAELTELRKSAEERGMRLVPVRESRSKDKDSARKRGQRQSSKSERGKSSKPTLRETVAAKAKETKAPKPSTEPKPPVEDLPDPSQHKYWDDDKVSWIRAFYLKASDLKKARPLVVDPARVGKIETTIIPATKAQTTTATATTTSASYAEALAKPTPDPFPPLGSPKGAQHLSVLPLSTTEKTSGSGARPKEKTSHSSSKSKGSSKEKRPSSTKTTSTAPVTTSVTPVVVPLEPRASTATTSVVREPRVAARVVETQRAESVLPEDPEQPPEWPPVPVDPLPMAYSVPQQILRLLQPKILREHSVDVTITNILRDARSLLHRLDQRINKPVEDFPALESSLQKLTRDFRDLQQELAVRRSSLLALEKQCAELGPQLLNTLTQMLRVTGQSAKEQRSRHERATSHITSLQDNAD